MEAIKLNAAVRGLTGKNHAKEMRQEGTLPGILYGKEIGSLAIKLSAKELDKQILAYGQNALYMIILDRDGREEQYTTLLREVQRHPFKGDLIHVDFYQVSLKEKLVTAVAVSLTGEPEGARNGGVLQYGLREVEVECLPGDLPENFTVDITVLDLGESITAADLKAPEGVAILSDPGSVLASIVAPRLEDKQEETAETAGEQAKPELVTNDEE